MLGHVEVSTGDDLTDIAVVRATRPNLLTSDDPLFAVALGLGAETRKIATCSRLTEQLATYDFAAVHLADVGLAGNVRSVRHDCWSDHSKSDGETRLIGDFVVGFKGLINL